MNRGVTIGCTSRGRPARPRISSIDRALASTPKSASASRYQGGVPVGWSIATRPTKARWPWRRQAAASAVVAGSWMLAWYTAVVVPAASSAGTIDSHTWSANSGSAKRASSGNVWSKSHSSSGRSRAVASWGH